MNRIEKRYIRGPLQRWADWPFLRYTIVGGLSFLLNIGLTMLLHEFFGVAERVAFAIALVTVFIINFLLARRVIFNADGLIYPQFISFVGTSIMVRGGEYTLFVTLLSFTGINYVIIVAFVSIVSFILKFFVYKTLVFKTKIKEMKL